MSNQEVWKPSINPWIMIIPVILSAFICILDTTIGNVALPHMAGTFSATRDESMWILTSYLVASGIIIPAVDLFSKIFGRKNYFVLSILLFTFSSMLCGMAQNLEFMIFARILQGIGGGGLVPVANAIVFEAFPVEKRGAAMSVFGLGVVIAPIIGPVLGGWITDNWSWPWIFFVNIPFGCLAALLANRFIEDPPYARKKKYFKFDGRGFFFLTIWLASFQIVLDKGNNADWFGSTWVCQTFTVSVITCILFFYSQFINKRALIDLSLFKDKNFTAGVIIQVVGQAVLYSSIAILPQFLQNQLGYTAYLSGVAVMTRGIGSILALVITANYSSKIDNRIFVLVGLILLGISGLGFGNLNIQISMSNVFLPNFIMGIAVGFVMIPIMNLTVITLKNEQMTNASAIQNLLKNVTGAVGTSLVSTLVSRFAQVHQFMLVGKLSPLNSLFVERINELITDFAQYSSAQAENMANAYLYKQLIIQSSLWGYIDVFRVFGAVSFVIIPLLLLIKIRKKI